MNNLNEFVEDISSKEEFLEFLRLLNQNLLSNEWQNNSLSSYLEGVESWVDDMEGYFLNMRDYSSLEKIRSNQLDWRIIAKILLAATMYE